MTWPLYGDIQAPNAHEHDWVDITSLDSVDLQFICSKCGGVKYVSRWREPDNV